MTRKCFLAGALAFCGLATTAWSLAVHGTDAALMADCEAKIDRAMQAYNAQDWQAFFKEYANMVSATSNEQTFQRLYVDRAHKNFGKYQSRTLMPARSTFATPVGLLVYQAKFSEKPATLTVNFFNEDGHWKLQQIRIDP